VLEHQQLFDCKDPDYFTPDEISQFLLSKKVDAAAVRTLVSHAADGATLGSLGDNALKAIGIDSAHVHSQILGQWRVLRKKHGECIREAEAAAYLHQEGGENGALS
jgi:hypothetical protein